MQQKNIPTCFSFPRNHLRLLLLILLFTCIQSKAQTLRKVKILYPDGRIQVKGKIRPPHDTTGTWLYFDQAGRVRRKEQWKNGKRHWVVEYNERHRKIRGINEKGEQIIYKGCNCPN